jgi:hypothetical protein
MTIVIPNDHHFIGYIAIAIHGHFKQGLAVKMSRYCLGWLLRDKGHNGSLPSCKDDMRDLNVCFPYFIRFLTFCSLFVSLIDRRKSVNDKQLHLMYILIFFSNFLTNYCSKNDDLSYWNARQFLFLTIAAS